MKTYLAIAILLQASPNPSQHLSSAFTVTHTSASSIRLHPFSSTVVVSSNTSSKWTVNTKQVMTLFSSAEGGTNNNNDEDNNEEGLSLAADFSKILQQRNIQLNEEDLLEDDEDDEEEEEILDEEQILNEDDMPTISDQQVYRELDERVLETAGGFVDLLSKDADDEDTDEDDDNDDRAKPKPYEAPTTIPDPELTAGEVVMTVLDALNHNDVPMPDYGIVVLFGYSSPGSAIAQAIDIEGMTPAEYGVFLKEEYEYKILFNHVEAIIEKGDYSADKKKAFFTARLQATPEEKSGFTNVNFILSASEGEEDGESGCWMIDSLLIRPEGMRRRRRK
jgi:hypothetical protein